MGCGLATHHLARLAAVGLVTVESEEGRYRVHANMLSTMTKRLLGLTVTSPPAASEAPAPARGPAASRLSATPYGCSVAPAVASRKKALRCGSL
jgi:hypothetical protein